MSKFNSIITLPILFVALMVGCTQQEDAKSLESQQTNNQTIQVRNSSQDDDLPEMNNREIAAHLANVANRVPEVNHATAVVAGPYAVVGIDVDEELDRSRVGTIKYTVLEALYHDPYGKTAVVVADADATARIRGIAEKIRQGQPVQGFVDELSAIVGRYMPDFPIRENVPEQSDQNKKQLDPNEERELKDIQDEQSNHNLR